MSTDLIVSVVLVFIAAIVIVPCVWGWTKRDWDKHDFLIWGWGSLSAALGIALILVIAYGRPADLYERVQNSSSALGAVVAASALAWSWFFQADQRNEKPISELKTMLEDVEKRLGELSARGATSPSNKEMQQSASRRS